MPRFFESQGLVVGRFPPSSFNSVELQPLDPNLGDWGYYKYEELLSKERSDVLTMAVWLAFKVAICKECRV